jgi:hypothetical protein
MRGPEIPADIAAAQGLLDWRKRVWWPVSITEANQICSTQTRRALTWAAGLDDVLVHDATLLALPNILAYARSIVLASLAASRAKVAGIQLITTEPEFAYLQTGEVLPSPRENPVLAPERIRSYFIRRAARIHSWHGMNGLLPALFRPETTAISHNHLLCATAAREPRAIGFRHAEQLLETARRPGSPAPVMERDHASALAWVVLGEEIADEPYRSRAHKLLEANAASHLGQAVADMAALRRIQLPSTVWSGSGGLYAPRAVGLEILNRGGRVIRFDHGTPKGFVRAPAANDLSEFEVSSEFVVATEAAADICRDDYGDGSAGARPVIIRGADGDPTFAKIPAYVQRPRRRRPRVVYAPTQLLGFRELLPVQQPDVVHLSWQIGVAEVLQEMEVELTCQPHPEGLFKGRPHPLEARATTIRGNFASQLREADVFVFDYPSTTALWEVACTDARIVFLDIGAGTMTKAVANLFRERARVLGVAHDEANRPILDMAALRDAVLDEGRPVDPTPFRRLLAGEG